MSLGTPRMEAIPCRTAGWLSTSAKPREGSLASEPLEGSLSSRFLTRHCHGVADDVRLLRAGGSCSVSESVSKALASWGRSSPLVTNVWSLPCAAHGSDRGRNSPRCRLAVPWSWSSALLLSRCTGTSADSSLSRGRTSPLSMRTTVLAFAFPAPGWLGRGNSYSHYQSQTHTARTTLALFF